MSSVRDGQLRSVSFSTSDDVAAELCEFEHTSWRLFELDYQIAVQNGCLLDMIVSGIRREFRPPEGSVRTAPKSKPFFVDPCLDLDPFDIGTAPLPSSSGTADADLQRIADDSAGESDVDGLRDLPADVVMDIHDVLQEAHGIPAAAEETEVPEFVDVGLPDPGDVLAEQGDLELGEDDVEQQPIAEAAAENSPENMIELFIASARVSGMGYVSCPVEPMNRMVNVGRITTFPASKPLPQRSVAVKCYLHSNCSVTRQRSRFEDHQLLRWLFAGECLPGGASAAQRAAAGTRHKALSNELLARAAARAGTSASSRA